MAKRKPAKKERAGFPVSQTPSKRESKEVAKLGKPVRHKTSNGRWIYHERYKDASGKVKSKVTSGAAWKAYRAFETKKIDVQSYLDQRHFLEFSKDVKRNPKTLKELDKKSRSLYEAIAKKNKGGFMAFNHATMSNIDDIQLKYGKMKLITAGKLIGQTETHTIKGEGFLKVRDMMNRIWKAYHKSFYENDSNTAKGADGKRLQGDSPTIIWAFKKVGKDWALDMSRTQFNDADAADFDLDELIDDYFG